MMILNTKTKLISALLTVTFVAFLPGCQTLQDHTGAAVGAGLGATAGVLLGGDTKGMIVGGLIGALVGGAVGHYAYDKRKTGEETATNHNYQPSEGSTLTIENASVSPAVIYPGDTVEVELTYAVLNPSPNTRTSLKEIREITRNGELVGKPEVVVSRTSGTYTSRVPIQLPVTAKGGTYDVKTVVESQKAKDERIVTFSVQRDSGRGGGSV